MISLEAATFFILCTVSHFRNPLGPTKVFIIIEENPLDNPSNEVCLAKAAYKELDENVYEGSQASSPCADVMEGHPCHLHVENVLI